MNRFQYKMREYRRSLLMEALVENGMNVSATARSLGFHRNHIDNIIREHDINIDLLRRNFRAALRGVLKGDILSDKSILSPSRVRLPETRPSITRKFTIGNPKDPVNPGVRGYVTVGMYEDGRPGEVFIHVDRVGSTAHGFAEAWATTFSLALQYGIPLSVLVDKAKHVRFEPMGQTDAKDNDELKFVSSIIDYIARWLEWRFLKGGPLESRKPQPQK